MSVAAGKTRALAYLSQGNQPPSSGAGAAGKSRVFEFRGRWPCSLPFAAKTAHLPFSILPRRVKLICVDLLWDGLKPESILRFWERLGICVWTWGRCETEPEGVCWGFKTEDGKPEAYKFAS